MASKKFHVGDVLTVTTGNLLGPRHLKGLYELLRHLCGEDIYTHQIPRVLDQCAPKILLQHPQLAGETGEGVTPSNHKEWLDGVVLRYGEYLDIEPLAPGEHYSIDPLSEAAEMVHPSNIVVIQR